MAVGTFRTSDGPRMRVDAGCKWKVLGQGKALESLGQSQGGPHVELLPSSKNRSNHCTIINLSMDYEHQYGPHLVPQQSPGVIENVGPPEMTEAAAT